MSMLICVPKDGGCGYAGVIANWTKGLGVEGDRSCPVCHQDYGRELNSDNFIDLTAGLSNEEKMQISQRLNVVRTVSNLSSWARWEMYKRQS